MPPRNKTPLSIFHRRLRRGALGYLAAGHRSRRCFHQRRISSDAARRSCVAVQRRRSRSPERQSAPQDRRMASRNRLHHATPPTTNRDSSCDSRATRRRKLPDRRMRPPPFRPRQRSELRAPLRADRQAERRRTGAGNHASGPHRTGNRGRSSAPLDKTARQSALCDCRRHKAPARSGRSLDLGKGLAGRCPRYYWRRGRISSGVSRRTYARGESHAHALIRACRLGEFVATRDGSMPNYQINANGHSAANVPPLASQPTLKSR